MTKEPHFEVTNKIEEADGVVCLRVSDAPATLANPTAYGVCFRCESPVVYHDIYPKGLPKLCTRCAVKEAEGHGPN